MDAALQAGTENLHAMEAARNYNADLLSLARWAVREGESGIDFGAGRGTFAVPMARDGCRVVCVEPDATSRAALQSHGIATHEALAELPAKSFDGAWSFNVIEHIDNDDAALSDLHRVLRPGGRLALYVPAFPILFSAMDRHVGHRRRYRRAALVALVERAGFTVERAYYVDCLGFPTALAFRAIGPRDGHLNPATVGLYDRWLYPASRALDRLFSGLFGKNVAIQARRRH